MANLKFDEISLLIADAGGGIRSEIKSILHYEGFREISEADTLPQVEEQIDEGAVDLLIIDSALPGGAVGDLIYRVRQYQLGTNPFIVVITMALDPSRDEIMQIIDSGSDDLLLKPISAGILKDRVNYLINDRKKFVVTSDYIGPTRRAQHREGTVEIPEFEVPNPLQAKAMGEMDDEFFQQEVDRFSTILNEQKMERNAVQIAYLVDRILPLYDEGEVNKNIAKPLNRLLFVVEDIGRRLEGTAYDHVGDLCSSMVSVVKNMCQSPVSPDPKDLRLLPELSQAIGAAFELDGESAELARDISASVRSRSQ